MADWKIKENSKGEIVAVEIEGEERPVDNADFLPSRNSVEDIRDVFMNLASTHEELLDSYDGGGITARIEATHGGYKNRNNFWYVTDGMTRSVNTWTTPIPAPYLLNHNKMEDARGRVQSANFVKTGRSTGYHDLDVGVHHEKEVEMVLDGRALCVSAGAHAVDTVECSVCGHDIYTDGKTPSSYEIDQRPSREWLSGQAPGMMGAFGMTNEDFWNIRPVDSEDRAKGYKVTCHHMRKSEAPMGQDSFQEVVWKFHEVGHDEISRVNNPADLNEATGEFAHIRKVLEATDGLDEETRAKEIVEQLSKVDSGAIDRARYSVLSEKQLWKPNDAQEAADYVEKVGDQVFWNKGLWQATCAMAEALPMQDRVKAYYEAGGRFVVKDAVEEDTLSPSDALQLDSTKEFYTWLRAQDFDRATRKAFDSAYTSKYLIRQRDD